MHATGVPALRSLTSTALILAAFLRPSAQADSPPGGKNEPPRQEANVDAAPGGSELLDPWARLDLWDRGVTRAEDILRLRLAGYLAETDDGKAAFREVDEAIESTRGRKVTGGSYRRLLERYDRALVELVDRAKPAVLRVGADRAPAWNSPAAPIALTEGVARLVPVRIVNESPKSITAKCTDDLPRTIAPGQTGHVWCAALVGDPKATSCPLRLTVDGEPRPVDVPANVTRSNVVRIAVRGDASSGAGAARVAVWGADGRPYWPEGVEPHLQTDGHPYCWVSGPFRVRLPLGSARVEAARGLEFRLSTRSFDVTPDAAAVELAMHRWIDMPALGWFSGDGHIHANYLGARGSYRVTPETVLRAVRAEDLHVANLLVANANGDDVFDREFFEGRPHRYSRVDGGAESHVLYWNEEFRSLLYGHLTLYRLRTLIEPLYTSYPSAKDWKYDFPPNATIADLAHAQGGLVSFDHAWQAKENEVPVDVALGKIDGLEVVGYGSAEPLAVDLWHRFLNCGFHLPATAGTDSFLSRVEGGPPGGARAYVHLGSLPPRAVPEEKRASRAYDRWCDGLKDGRSFVTNGPMLFFTVNGRESGATLALDRPGTVRVKVTARAEFPMRELVVWKNGDAVIRREAGAEAMTLEVDEDVPVEGSCWLAASVRGPENSRIFGGLLGQPIDLYAHANPVYVEVAGKRFAIRRDVEMFVGWIDRLSRKVRERNAFAKPAERDEVLALFARARAVYEGLLGDATP